MAKTKIAITLEERMVRRLDQLVRDEVFASRSQAIQQAVEERLDRLDRGRLARESAKLDPAYERALAEEGLSEDLSKWPEY
ncbi:MAG TPA: ribbon-helix-helix domain-containing protein [Gemmatimonadota bacterium]|nr:ribbon-helix-helix domain-containing protein [Gemmatimonadota bacterium]